MSRAAHYKAIIFNTLKTPNNYKKDYLLSHFSPEKLNGKRLPWMNYEVIDYLLLNIASVEKVFEYGSGQSTLFWLDHGKKVTSIEHDPAYYGQMRGQFASFGAVDYQLIEPEIDLTGAMHNPSSSLSAHSADFKGYSFSKYVESINRFPDEFFDVIVVDGRARPSCMLNSIPKLKPGGFLILDNSNRHYYLQEVAPQLIGWNSKTFFGTVRGLLHSEQTTVYVKPAGVMQ